MLKDQSKLLYIILKRFEDKKLISDANIKDRSYKYPKEVFELNDREEHDNLNGEGETIDTGSEIQLSEITEALKNQGKQKDCTKT